MHIVKVKDKIADLILQSRVATLPLSNVCMGTGNIQRILIVSIFMVNLHPQRLMG